MPGPSLFLFLILCVGLVVIQTVVLGFGVLQWAAQATRLTGRVLVGGTPWAFLRIPVITSSFVTLLAISLYDGSRTSDKVIALVALVGLTAALALTRRGRIAERSPRDVFVCHVSQDKEAIARPVARALEEQGMSVWLDEAEMRWGDRVKTRIEEGLASSRFVLVVVSEHMTSKRSRWVQLEVLKALAMELALDRTRVLPLVATAEWEDLSQELGPVIEAKQVLRWSGDGTDVARALLALMPG